MGYLNAVVNTKRQGGLNRQAPSQDMISGLLATTPIINAWDTGTTYDQGDRATYEVDGTAQVYESLSGSNTGNQPDTATSDWQLIAPYVPAETTWEFRSLRAAQAQGIDADFDTSFDSRLYAQIEDFFRMNPDGILWVRLAPRESGGNPVLNTDLCDKTNTAWLPQLWDDAAGAIRQCLVMAMPGSSHTWSYANHSLALPDDIIDAVYKAQQIYDDNAFPLHRPTQIVLPGEGLDLNNPIPDLRGAPAAGDPEFDAEAVSVCIGSDNSTTPALGALAGTISAADVSQNIGEVASFNLQDAAAGKFLTPSLTDGTAVKDVGQDVLDELNTKGFIYAAKYIDFDGVYWNDSHTCVAITSDYAYIEQQRTIDKAIRVGRQAVLERAKERVTIDEATGYIDETDLLDLENHIREALTQRLENPGDASATDAYIPPEQDLINGDLQFEVSLIGRRIIRTMTKSYGFERAL